MSCLTCACSAERDESGDRICGCDSCSKYGCIYDERFVVAIIKLQLIFREWYRHSCRKCGEYRVSKKGQKCTICKHDDVIECFNCMNGISHYWDPSIMNSKIFL